jgi:hypothetical protein
VQSPDAAALTMDLRDYDFHLFTEDGEERDGVVYRCGSSGYRLALAGSQPFPDRPTAAPLTVDRAPPPQLTLPEATRILELNPVPFLSFVVVGTGRVAVLYRRYDGRLGIVTPLW